MSIGWYQHIRLFLWLTMTLVIGNALQVSIGIDPGVRGSGAGKLQLS